jgi:hypothetical protein
MDPSHSVTHAAACRFGWLLQVPTERVFLVRCCTRHTAVMTLHVSASATPSSSQPQRHVTDVPGGSCNHGRARTSMLQHCE